MREMRLVEVGMLDGSTQMVGIDAKLPILGQMPEDWLVVLVAEVWGTVRIVRGFRKDRPARSEAAPGRPGGHVN